MKNINTAFANGHIPGSLNIGLAVPRVGTAIAPLRIRKSTMIDAQNLRRCRECETVFEPDVADRDPSGEARCPQCFLASSDDVHELDQGEMVIRQSTPFR